MLKNFFLLRKINNEIFKMIDMKTKVQDIAIDFQDIEYYGSRSTPNIRKLKSKNKTPETN
jgi:hypothetical protein